MKHLLIFLFLANTGFAQQQQYDIVIIGGKIIDGTGNSWFYGDVAIKEGKPLMPKD